jgi:hypothetical protein
MPSSDWSHTNPMFTGGSDEEATRGGARDKPATGKSTHPKASPMRRSTISAAPATQSPVKHHGIPVLPAVDANLGTVVFAAPGGWQRYWTPDPGQLVDALSKAVSSARWLPESRTLVVTVAANGVRQGRGLGFLLTAL